jgi:hypothetical protein
MDTIKTTPNKIKFTAKLVDLTVVDIMLPLDTPQNSIAIKDKAIDVIEFFAELNKEQKEKASPIYLEILTKYPKVSNWVDQQRDKKVKNKMSVDDLTPEEQKKLYELYAIMRSSMSQETYKKAYQFIIDTFFVGYKRTEPKAVLEGEDLQITNLENFEQFFGQILNYKEIVDIYVNLYEPFVSFLD